jgi:hypothetical protein
MAMIHLGRKCYATFAFLQEDLLEDNHVEDEKKMGG